MLRPPVYTGGNPRPAAPNVVPLSGDIDQRLAQVVGMVNALAASLPHEPVILQDTSGQSWLVTVSTAGVLQTTLITR